MIINPDSLYFLFATGATIIATLTGLIGSFSTFRLQDSAREINLLKDIVLKRQIDDKHSLLDIIRTKDYTVVEQIFDRTLQSVTLLKRLAKSVPCYTDNVEILMDIDNICRNQIIYDEKKKLTINGFKISLLFVVVSLFLLALTDSITNMPYIIWFVLIIYFSLIILVLLMLIRQLKKLVY